MRSARNVAIIAVLAAVVAFAPGGGEGAGVLSQALGAVFTVAIVAILARLYRQFRSEIFSLGDRWRGVLYVSIAVLLLSLAGGRRLLELGGAGTLAFFVLVGGSLYAMYRTWRQFRAYA